MFHWHFGCYQENDIVEWLYDKGGLGECEGDWIESYQPMESIEISSKISTLVTHLSIEVIRSPTFFVLVIDRTWHVSFIIQILNHGRCQRKFEIAYIVPLLHYCFLALYNLAHFFTLDRHNIECSWSRWISVAIHLFHWITILNLWLS